MMSSKELDNLAKVGTLKPEAGDQSEFDGLVRSGTARLTDAKRPALSPESRFDLAYNAAHAFALAALRWHGYRPNNKRYVVFSALEHTLRLRPEIWRVLDKCHGARNLAEYEGSFIVDQQLLLDLIAAAEKVQAAIDKLGPIGKPNWPA
jgi:hypothetical protein